jgi:hypothetical protein
MRYLIDMCHVFNGYVGLFASASKTRTVSATQAAEMVRHGVEVIPVRRYLQAGVIGWVDLRARAVDAWWERRGHVVRQVEAFEREVDMLFDLVCERAFEREAFQVDE